MSREIPTDERSPGVVARYMARPPITPERMLGDASGVRVIYRSDEIHPRHRANFRVLDALDFLAEVSAHIPDAHEKTTLFYGWYSNRTRGYRKRHGLLGAAPPTKPVPDGDTRARLETRRSWARLIRQVYEVDPLVCLRCGGTMKIIAMIERPAVVRQILDHLSLPPRLANLRAPPDPGEGLAAEQPHEWLYESVLDDLSTPDPAMA